MSETVTSTVEEISIDELERKADAIQVRLSLIREQIRRLRALEPKGGR